VEIRVPKRFFFVALAVRLLPVLLSFRMGIGMDDMFQYDMLARSLVAGNGFRWYSEPDLNLISEYIPVDLTGVAYDSRGMEAAFRGPMYPIFLAGIYFFSGMAHRFFAARLAQAVLGALLAPMAYLLAGRLDPEHDRTASLAAWIVALYPMLVLYPLALATENLFFVLTLGCVLLLLRGTDGRKPGGIGPTGWFALAGAVLGLAFLARSVVGLFLPLAVFWIGRNAKSVRGAMVFALAAAAVAFPWVLRNSILAGRPASVEVSLGYDLYMGYHPQSSGTFQYGISMDLLTIFNDVERDQIGIQKAAEFIRHDPGRVPYLIVRKAGYFFGLESRALEYFYSNNFLGYISLPALLGLAAVFLLPLVLLVPAAAFGGVALPRSDVKTLVLFFFLAYITPHLLILAEDRFHMTLIPYLAAMGAAAVIRRREIFSSLRAPQAWRTWWFPVLATLLLAANWGFELWSQAPGLGALLGPSGNTTYFPY
jgi:4-amino-4-deoxy-L-arabinose transferase-like glycosyltransferase